MALLTRLRIAGFKSFADATTIDILPGLTGIVGPNGCGKSNVVEALRWAMGENSARSLRGGDMDDVIFAGTASRASRNLAEVAITLERDGDNTPLPDPFGADAELTVSRKIERGSGSSYRGNGREMRARDVQTLYADLASGARSSGMVSQGRVAALVNAKPEERRQVLEEAAGITGLHARRHEAELKLRAAEANLSKAADLRAQLDGGREDLRKQARQASRYRNISGLVRGAETELLAAQHARASRALELAEGVREEAWASVQRAEAARLAAAAELAQREAVLPGPREAEARARSLLERRRLEAEMLSGEAARAAQVLAEAEARLLHAEADLEDAGRAAADAEANAARLRAEIEDIEAQSAAMPAEIEAAEAAIETARSETAEAQRLADQAAHAAAEGAASFRQADIVLADAQRRLDAARAAHAAAMNAAVSAEAACMTPSRLEAVEHAVAQAEAALRQAREDAEAAQIAAQDAAHAQSRLEEEATRAAKVHEEATQREQDAAARLERLAAAHATIAAELARARTALVPDETLAETEAHAAAARVAAEQAEVAVRAAEAALSECGPRRLAAIETHERAVAEHARLAAASSDAGIRRSRLEQEHCALAASVTATEAQSVAPSRLADAAEKVRHAAEAAETARLHLAEAASRRTAADEARSRLHAEAEAAKSHAARLGAEAEGLARALGGDDETAAVFDRLDVPDGLELAFGAALESCAGSFDPQAPRFWRALPMPAVLEGTLATLIDAPAELARALAYVRLIGDGADGDTLQAALEPGWTLVSRAGALWRWDGQVTRPGAPNRGAERLRQRTRARHAAEQATEARLAAGQADTASLAAQTDLEAMQAAEMAAREREKQTLAALEAARAEEAALSSEAGRIEALLAAQRPSLNRLTAELADAVTAAAAIALSLAALPDAATLHASRAEAEHAEAEASRAVIAARHARDTARRDDEAAAAARQSLQAQAREAIARVEALAPQCDHLAAEADAARRALASAQEYRAGLPDSEALAQKAMNAAGMARTASERADAARDAARAAEQAWNAAIAARSDLERRGLAAEHALQTCRSALERAQSELAGAEASHREAANTRALLPDPASLAEAAQEARQLLAAARHALTDAESTRSRLLAAREAASARLPRLRSEHEAWAARQLEAARKHTALATRTEAARQEARGMRDGPALLARRAAESGTALTEAERAHADAAAALAAADAACRAASQAEREAAAAESGFREGLARAEGAISTAQAALASVLTNAVERLGPEAVLPDAEPSEAAEERARRKLDRLTRERDDMGPVNLRADIELGELDTRVEALDRERAELETAIAKLRGSIGHLNREGRERLQAVFADVDRHFRTLFTRMMGGGRAHLALTGSEDPLEAGLEIFAEPPGKKLTSLSLLSGGEQALTALSLIFAVFRCTPAPVAVLDEVDAPLDEANVERFCTLLDDVVRDTGTRFLVVTHHQLTMSRMDRLFGVTMQERGVSRILSVDLHRAAEIVEEPVLQAAE